MFKLYNIQIVDDGNDIGSGNMIFDKFEMSQEENIFCAKRIVVDSVYMQANLEGISISFAQTQDIFNNINVLELTPIDICRVCCLRDTWLYLLDNTDESLDMTFIEELHKLIARFDMPYYYLGKIRTEEVMISGAGNWRPEITSRDRIQIELKELLNADLSITDKAVRIGLWIMRTQPFKDGNKRVGCFVINKILIQNGRGIFNVPVELDEIFKIKLVKFYITNNYEELSEWIRENCLNGVREIKYTS